MGAGWIISCCNNYQSLVGSRSSLWYFEPGCEVTSSYKVRSVLFCVLFLVCRRNCGFIVVFRSVLVVFPSCPTGGPAEGNADQLPVSGGGFRGFIETGAELIKGQRPSRGVGREVWKWKERPREVKSRDRKRGSRRLPCSPAWWGANWGNTPGRLFFTAGGDPLKSPSLHSYMEKTPATVNKRQTWEALIFTFQTPDHGPSS